MGLQKGNGSIPSRHSTNSTHPYIRKIDALRDRILRDQWYTTSKPDVKMTKLWSHQHEGILKTVTDPKELEQAIGAINVPDGVLAPGETGWEHHIPDVWEPTMNNWGLSDPEMPKPPTPPPPTRTEEQEHAMKHWSFCRKPDCKYHRGNQSYYL